MNNEGVKIRYGDVAPEAKENFAPEASEKETFADLAQLQQYNLKFPNYANPCEYGAVLLDGSADIFPAYPENENMGLWSRNISGADGTFETPVVLTLTSSGQYSSQGFTLTFDTYNNIFCNDLSITWYRNGTQIETSDFAPNSAFYFCRKKAENFDKVVITFKKLNMPYNRLKLRVIDYGYGTYFFGDELRSANIIQELSPISSELAVNTADFTLDSKTDMEYSFQSKQPLSIYFNGELRATTFVSKSQRQAKNIWKIESEDYVGQLAKLTFMGGMYSGKNAKELLVSIFTQAKTPYSIADELSDKTVTGYIPICDCREAVRQICFAIGAVCSTANSDCIKVYTLSDNVMQNVPLSRIRQGQSFDEEDRITAVKLTAHNYIPIYEETEAYKAGDSGTGENIFVRFSEPLHDLTITHGTIISSSANFAIINANENCVLTGQKYDDTVVVHTKNNPVVSANDLENIAEITDATLINPSNVSEILTKTFDFVSRRSTTKLQIYEGRHRVRYGEEKYGGAKYGQWIFDSVVNTGDVITSETEYLGNVTGRIVSQRYSLNGGILLKECELI